MAQNNQDQLLSELVEKIQQFFTHQIETNSSLSDAAKESLSVANECIEQAYNIQRKSASEDLVDIFKSHKKQPPPSSNQSATPGGQQDPTQLLTNLASSIFSQVGGGLMGAPVGSGHGEEQQRATATSNPQSATPNDALNASVPPKQRKKVTDAEKLAAESFKNQGNDYMKQDKYKEAYDSYTKAIEIDDNNAIYYSNRAAASSKLGNHHSALRDCQEAIEIDPTYSKAYGRLGLAYASLENHQEAKKAYVKAVELDPTNESYQNNLNIAEERLAEQQGGGQPGGSGSGGANVMGVLRSMMTNPQVMSLAMQSLQDPRIQGMFGLNGQQQTPPNRTADDSHQQSADSAPPNQQADNQQHQSSAGSQTQSPLETFSPVEILNLSSRVATNANIDLVGAGQQLLSSIQQNNPDLVDNMRRMMGQAFNPNGPGRGNQNDRNPPPGYS